MSLSVSLECFNFITQAYFLWQAISIQFEGICWLKVLIREEENRGIPSRAMLELRHCCTVYLVIFYQFPDIILCQGSERKEHIFFFHWHPSNRDWFSILTVQFCSDFLSLHYKEITKCVRPIFQWVRVRLLPLWEWFWEWFDDFEKFILFSSTFPNFSRVIPRFASSMADLYLLHTNLYSSLHVTFYGITSVLQPLSFCLFVMLPSEMYLNQFIMQFKRSRIKYNKFHVKQINVNKTMLNILAIIISASACYPQCWTMELDHMINIKQVDIYRRFKHV